MLKGLGNIASLLNSAKTMGPKMQEMQEKLSKERVVGTSGGGMVSVHASGDGKIISVEFDSVLSESKDMEICLLYTSPSPRDGLLSRMPSSA